MMKRLIIVCEGPTEKEFCMDVLAPHFLQKGISVNSPLIKHSGGGIVSWRILKSQIERHLNEADVVVTTLIDYYGIKDAHLFPCWKESKAVTGNRKKVLFLEEAMRKELADSVRYRFFPYLQLHEFESLLFSNIRVFKQNFAESELNYSMLEAAIREFPNPEDINNNPLTAPSKRIEAAIAGYNKVLYGNSLAMDIGLEQLRTSCPHFNDWISSLENI